MDSSMEEGEIQKEIDRLLREKRAAEGELLTVEQKIYRMEKKYQKKVAEDGGDVFKMFDVYLSGEDSKYVFSASSRTSKEAIRRHKEM